MLSLSMALLPPNNFEDATALSVSSRSEVHDQLLLLGESLHNAGELTADMACKLPNWYSSKEGLSGESPAVFGGAGLGLMQAGQSLLLLQEENTMSIRTQWLACAGDIAATSCALDPIFMGDELEEACELLFNQVKRVDNADDADGLKSAGEAFQDAAGAFDNYGTLLCNEDHATDTEGSAGAILSKAGKELHRAGEILKTISWPDLRKSLLLEDNGDEWELNNPTPKI